MKEFRRLIGEQLSDFSLIHAETAERELIFEKIVAGNLSLFFRVFAYDRREEFDIDLAWRESPSCDAKPEFPTNATPLMQPYDPPDEDGVCFALHWLKPNPGKEVVGWNLAPDPDVFADVEEWLKPPPTVEELLPKVPELVGEAMEALVKLGMPYFERVLAERISGQGVGATR